MTQQHSPMKKVLVTGATGFLGAALCRRLLELNVAVRATARSASHFAEGQNLEWRHLDLSKPPDWADLLEGIDTVYHLAWSSIPARAASNPVEDLTLNVGGVIHLLEHVKYRPELRVIFASSGGTVYGQTEQKPIKETAETRPLSAYGVAKLTAEAYFDLYRVNYGVNSVALRIANPFGTGQDASKGLGAVSHFVRAATTGQPVTLFGDGSTVRDFIAVDDVTNAMILAGEERSATGPINIGSGSGLSLLDVIGHIENISGIKLAINKVPSRIFDVDYCVLDIAKANKLLKWSPVISFEDNLRRLVLPINL